MISLELSKKLKIQSPKGDMGQKSTIRTVVEK